MAKKVQVFEYQGKKITFDFGDGEEMINATEIAKAFNKKLDNFNRLKQTKQFIQVLEDSMNSAVPSHVRERQKAIRIVRGGNRLDLQGTWYEQRLALKLAAWLSPEFELWTYGKIRELLITGTASIPRRQNTSLVKAIRLIADELEDNKRDIAEVKEDVTYLKDFVYELESKVITRDENYYSVAGYCRLHGIHCELKQAQKWGKAATVLSKNRGFDIGSTHDPRFGWVGTYHKEILNEILKP